MRSRHPSRSSRAHRSPLVVAEPLENRRLFVSVFGFVPEEIKAAGSPIVTTGDADGDGKIDLVVANRERAPKASLGRPKSKEDVYVWKVRTHLGVGDGTFKLASETTLPVESVTGVAVGDVNGDGRADLVVTERKSGSVILQDREGNEVIRIAAGVGGGAFETGRDGDAVFRKSWVIPHVLETKGIALGDVNGDGSVDVAVLGIVMPSEDEIVMPSESTGNRMSVFVQSTNDSPGKPSPGQWVLGTDRGDVWDEARLFATDLNGDGIADLVGVNDEQAKVRPSRKPQPNILQILGNAQADLKGVAFSNPLYDVKGVRGENPLFEGRTFGIAEPDKGTQGAPALVGAIDEHGHVTVLKSRAGGGGGGAGGLFGPASVVRHEGDGPDGKALSKGVFVASGDVDGDGRSDLLLFSGDKTYVGIKSKEDVYVWKIK